MGTVVVILENRGRVLIGESGKYLQDTQKLGDVQSFAFPNTPDGKRDAERAAQRQAKSLKALGFTPLVWKTDPPKGPRYSTKFLGPGTTVGLLKGGIERGETPEQAAVREIREETGFNLNEGRMQSTSSPTVFRIELTDREATEILASWDRLRRETGSELVALQWKTPGELRPLKDLVNSETKSALGFGGRRKTKRRRQRLTRRRR
jgi:hypothetical protein